MRLFLIIQFNICVVGQFGLSRKRLLPFKACEDGSNSFFTVLKPRTRQMNVGKVLGEFKTNKAKPRQVPAVRVWRSQRSWSTETQRRRRQRRSETSDSSCTSTLRQRQAEFRCKSAGFMMQTFKNRLLFHHRRCCRCYFSYG